MFFTASPKPSRLHATLRVAVASLCVLLILFVGAADLLHSHAANDAANPGCSLCAVAHLAAAPAAEAATVVLAESLRPPREDLPLAAPAQSFPFSLYVRPPPAI